ncbi:toll/interleukin-1 receptor domain-containing protein [Mariprofundus ferrooxydans]|uniref:TIR domain protein n=1 Tax=Mariprofundus ferrooxydans PV-1 TaxID=314345 RepID=Q0EWQ0_9PROT|nr:toll/interleukin-1 receptor domain-containing protein [Mariprofundus ferrooxydans]EAU53739.1 TIR domain protein [Mariprofundus ferrooxydans PV-1]
MTIFISYSHADKDRVDLLAGNMVKRNAQVWVDRWELSVGDSLIQRVQEAITESDALLIVLSKASVESEWCKKELSVGLIRELEEKRVVVLPVLLEDCEIPLFLRDKMYADLRVDFDAGLHSILEAVAKVSNPNQSRFSGDEGYVDWAVDWGDVDGLFFLRFTIINANVATNLKMTFLIEINVICNEVLTARQKQFQNAGLDWVGRNIIAEALFDFGDKENFHLVLDSTLPKKFEGAIGDITRGAVYDVVVTCRRLGEDNGKDQVINISNYLKDIREYMHTISKKLTPDEQQRLMKIIATPMGT